jgi:translation initiation factor 6
VSVPLVQVDIQGSPYVGVFGATNDHLALLPPHATNVVPDFEAALEVPVLLTTLGGATVLGAVVALNSRGAILADIATEAELKELEKRGLKTFVLEGKLNAAGNNVLCNDQGALVHPDFTVREVDGISSALGVPAERGTIAGIGTVGSAGVCTNKGALTHPKITAKEKQRLEGLLGVSSNIGTVNHGTPYIGAGLVANSKGCIIGRLTSGPEMNRLEDALGYL